jgi:hypothetical protein
MNRAELEEVFNRVYIGHYKKNEKKKVFDGSKTLDRNYFSRVRRVSSRHGPFFENIFVEKFEKSLPFFEKFEKFSKKNYFTNY